MNRICRTYCVCLVPAFLCISSIASTAVAQLQASPQALPADPAVVWGQLDNGLRYASETTGASHGQGATLLLQVRAGSWNESEAERGAATLVQRLAFAGSTHYAPGEMVPAIKRLQPSFNPRTNFIAGSDATIYRLDLADTRPETLKAGLAILADWAAGLSLLPEQVEQQRTMIEAEQERANTPERRIQLLMAQDRFAGTPLAAHTPFMIAPPPGKLNGMTLRSFYDAWYRPEEMVLVVVGNIDAQAVAAQVREQMGQLTDRAPARPRPDFNGLTLTGQPVIRLHREADAIGTDLWVERIMTPMLPTTDSVTRLREQLARRLGEEVFTRRIEALAAQDSDLPLANAGIFFLEGRGPVRFGLHASAREQGQALPAFQIAMEQYRRMLAFGPNDAELAFARSMVAQELDADAAGAESLPNAEVAGRIAEASWPGRVPQSPAQRRDLLKPMLATINRSEIIASFRVLGDPPARTLVAMTGREDPGTDGEQVLRQAYAKAMASPLVAPVEGVANTWAYGTLSDPDGMQWIQESPSEAALGIQTRWSRNNGLRMQVRRSQQQPGKVLVSLRFEIQDATVKVTRKAGVNEWIERGLAAGGLGRHTAEEVKAIFAKSSVRFTGVHISDDAVTYTAECAGNDLSRALQLLRAYYGDPGWRNEAEAPAKRAWLDVLAAQAQDLSAQVERRIDTALAGPYAWRRPATVEEVQALTFDDARVWLGQALENATLTVTVSGDANVHAMETVEQWMGRYQVHARFMMASIDNARALALPPEPLPAGVQRIAVHTSSHEAVLRAVWPAGDGLDIHQVRRQQMLADTLAERLQTGLSSRFGTSASLRCWSTASETVRDTGQIHVLLKVPDAQADEALAWLKSEAAAFADEGVSRQSFDRVKAATLQSVARSSQSDLWWFETVLPYAGWQPFRIGWASHAVEDVESVDKEQVDAAARRSFKSQEIFAVVGVPTMEGP